MDISIVASAFLAGAAVAGIVTNYVIPRIYATRAKKVRIVKAVATRRANAMRKASDVPGDTQ